MDSTAQAIAGLQARAKKRTRKEDSDDEDAGSLKDFIVNDSDDGSADASSEASDDEASDEGSDASDEASEEASEDRPTKKRKAAEDEAEALQTLAEEAARITAGVSGTVVGGRTLRSREPAKVEARKPRDEYYERFGRAEEARLLEKFTKKDIIEFVKSLEAEWRASYEAAGNTWPTLNARMSLESIREKYDHVKAFAELPDSDDEASDDDDESEAEDDAEEDSEGTDEASEASHDGEEEESE